MQQGASKDRTSVEQNDLSMIVLEANFHNMVIQRENIHFSGVNPKKPFFDESESYAQPGTNLTQVTILNHCHEPVDLLTIHSDGKEIIHSYRYLSSGKAIKLPVLEESFFHLFGIAGPYVWLSQDEAQNYCLDEGACYEMVKTGSNKIKLTYALACAGPDTSNSITRRQRERQWELQREKISNSLEYPPWEIEFGAYQKAPIHESPSLSPTGISRAPVQMSPSPTSLEDKWHSAYLQSDYQNQWLEAHNSRRTELFEEYGLGPRDLKWSSGLANSSQEYAEILIELEDCTIRHYVNNNTLGGENLVYNWNRKNNPMSPDVISNMWFDKERDLGLWDKLHLTQMVWRSTQYLGCGLASKDLRGGKCFIQVCRYVRPGNCGITEKNWEQEMLAESTRCEPSCPPEGCFE